MTQLALPPNLLADLQQVEQIVLERTHSRAAVISVAGPSVLQPASDRLRAATVLLAAQVGNYQLERVLHAAAAVELIYAATQTHTRLVDEAERRRGRALSGEWNHGVSLMVGDYLFALAAGEMALSPDARVITYYSEAVMQISEGELAPAAPLAPLELARLRHLERIGDSHAALVAAACRAGAVCGGVPPEQIELLGAIGHNVGLALHLGDELHDFGVGAVVGDEQRGASLRAGVITLPLIFAASAGNGERLAAALDSSELGEQSWAAEEVRSHGAVAARAELERIVAETRDLLAALPMGEGRAGFVQIVDYLERRAL